MVNSTVFTAAAATMTQGVQNAWLPRYKNRVSSSAYKKLFPIPVPPEGRIAQIHSARLPPQKLLRNMGRIQKISAVMAEANTLFSLLDKNRVKKIVASNVLSLIHI